MNEDPDDLGFTFKKHKSGEVKVFHHGKLATTLRGSEAQVFLVESQESTGPALQQLMARMTGNYKRGNERLAAQHPRNRR